MITVITQPPTLNLSRNPIAIEVKTDDLYTNGGTQGQLLFGLPGGLAAAQTITFTWGSYTVVLTATAVPNNTGLEITYYSGGSMLVWATAFVAEVNQNYEISHDFIFTLGGVVAGVPWFSMLARVPGSDYTPTQTTLPATSVNIITVPGVNKTIRDNFHILLILFVETVYGSGTYDRIIELEATPSTLGLALFRLETILDSLTDLQLPQFAQTAITAFNSFHRKFKLQYAERFGIPAVIQKLSNTSVFHVIKAGMAPEYWPGVNVLNDVITIKKKFLSFWPTSIGNSTVTKTVLPTQQDYLVWYNWYFDYAVKLNCTLYFDDGSSATHLLMGYGSTMLHDAILIPAGYTQLGLAALTPIGLAVVSYDLWLTAGGVTVTEVRTYQLDVLTYVHNRVFLFFNSLGAPETFHTHAPVDHSAKFEAAESVIYLPHDYEPEAGEFTRSNVNVTEMYSTSTGPLNEEEAKYMTDVLRSSQMYEIRNGRFIPVVVDPSKVKVVMDGEMLQSLEFDFKLSYNKHSYSPPKI